MAIEGLAEERPWLPRAVEIFEDVERSSPAQETVDAPEGLAELGFNVQVAD